MKSINNSMTLNLALACTIMTVLLFTTAAATAQTYTRLYTYPIGSGAYSGILAPQVMSQGRDGNLYTTIANNGTQSKGTVARITTAGAPTTIYNFCSLTSCADGSNPLGGVTLGFDGNFYGTTQGGGSHAAGSVFKVTPTGTLTTLWNFANGTDDSVPYYTTSLGQDGNMYGVSWGQYNGQYGALFKVSAAGVFKALSDFTYTNGALPNLPTQGTDLNFYGTTQSGGDATCKCGVVYKATAAGKVTVLHAFKGYPTDGYRPIGILVQGTDGNFYGTTYQGGAHNQGSVFKITPSGVFTLLYSFNFSSSYLDADLPEAGLTLGTDGNLYGVGTAGGSKNAGAIFKITPAGSESILYNFCSVTCNDGFGPATPLVLHTDGKFYGNTNGNSLGGSVFYSLDVGFTPLVNLVTWDAKVGKTVEILGQGFTGTTAVAFNGVNATFNNVSDTYMTAVVPAGALTGTVTVTTFTSTMKSNRAFLVTPQVKSFTPASGIVGTSVTITGVSLTQATKVTIGGKPASFTVNSDTQVTATVPAGAKTGAKIAITTPGGIANSPSAFAVIPSISGFSPTSGPVGTSVTITGNSFTKATKVTFGGVAATSYQVISDTQVKALVPTGAVTGRIAVTTLGGTGTSSTNFTVQ
ncbi:MAG: IPT/TIG domain-containing protein [Acidobacteriia bacterium]|nr:IPT/TIG domain-containing protein [Terriglobia bacterium]